MPNQYAPDAPATIQNPSTPDYAKTGRIDPPQLPDKETMSQSEVLKDGTLTGVEENTGVRVKASPIGYDSGDFVVMTGISSLFKDGSGNLHRQILPLVTGGIRKLVP